MWPRLLLVAVALALLSHALPLLLERLLKPATASDQRIVRAIAYALVPFVLGLSAITVLALLPQGSDFDHAMAPLIVALVAVAAHRFAARGAAGPAVAGPSVDRGLASFLFAAACIVILATTAAAFVTPLSENDALEHAIVGRELYAARDLAVYPLLNTATASGMYAPWTHAPLYAALIAQSFAIQGFADTALLMRAIAPLFLLSAVGLTYALASRYSRSAGCLAALIVLSTPLLGRSVIASGIDALPVAGLILALAPLALTTVDPLRRSALAGVCLGIALLTHAQAVAFVPIVAVVLWATIDRPARDRLALLALLLAIALAAGAWPYAKNLRLFGVLISDMPAVFALPELAWQEYFRSSRGLVSFSDRLLNGAFKGWFALQSFAGAFWLLLIGGTACWLARSRIEIRQALPAIAVSAIAIVLYQCALLAAVAADMDQMIRNDRYLLPLVPAVAVVAAIGMCDVFARWSPRSATVGTVGIMGRARILTLGGAALISVPIVTGLAFQWYGAAVANRMTPDALLQSTEARAEQLPSIRVARAIDTLPSGETLVLSLRPADMFYAKRRMISYLDPRLVDYYRQTDVDKAFSILRSLGITHFHVPDYSLPVDYNSALPELLSDPRLTRLVHFDSGYALYELAAGQRFPRVAIPLASSHDAWTSVDVADRLLTANTGSASAGALSPLLVARRLTRGATVFLVPSVRATQGSQPASPVPIGGGAEVRVEVVAQGAGFARLYVLEFDAEQRVLAITRLAEAVMTETPTLLSRRLVTRPATRGLRVAIQVPATSEVKLGLLKLHRIEASVN